MKLADLFPEEYVIAQAWRKWFGTDSPPLHSIDELHEWRENWATKVNYLGSRSGSWDVPEAFDRRATTILGFSDDPDMKLAHTAFLWNNADNALLREITADRREIASVLGMSEYAAGLFVLTGLLREGRLAELLKQATSAPPKPMQEQTGTLAEVANELTRDPRLFMAVGMANQLLDEWEKRATAEKAKAPIREPQASESARRQKGRPPLESWFDNLTPEELEEEKTNAEKYIAYQKTTTKERAAKLVGPSRRTMEDRVKLLKRRGILGTNSGGKGN